MTISLPKAFCAKWKCEMEIENIGIVLKAVIPITRNVPDRNNFYRRETSSHPYYKVSADLHTCPMCHKIIVKI